MERPIIEATPAAKEMANKRDSPTWKRINCNICEGSSANLPFTILKKINGPGIRYGLK